MITINKEIEKSNKDTELLNYIVQNGIIDVAVIEQQFMMSKIKDFVNVHHKNKIWKGSDGRWRTHIYIAGKRKLKVRSTENDLYDLLYDYYTSDAVGYIKPTFSNMFQKYKEYKKNLVSDNTIYKYEHDYLRMFEGTKFADTDVTLLSEEDITVFIVKRIRELNLRKKAFEAMYGYMKSTFKYCKNHKIIKDNPFDFMERKDFYKYCNDPYVDPKDRVVNKTELVKIQNKIHLDRQDKPDYIVPYAVELASYTGMRVGELAALKWEDVNFSDNTISINKAEVYNAKTKEYSISHTKNGMFRVIPMTDEIKRLLIEVKKVETKYGYLSEFVFSDKNGRIHKIAIGRCASNKSLQAGVEKSKPIHSYRRTINSRLKMNGVSTTVAAALLGHTEEVNNQYYTYDVSDMDYKRNALEQASM